VPRGCKKLTESVTRFTNQDAELADLCRRLMRWAADNEDALSAAGRWLGLGSRQRLPDRELNNFPIDPKISRMPLVGGQESGQCRPTLQNTRSTRRLNKSPLSQRGRLRSPMLKL
jgi:hypothetical protein